MGVSPWIVLQEAMKGVPAAKYVLAVAALGAVVAIVYAWQLDVRVAGWGAIIVLALAVVVLVFAKLSILTGSYFQGPATMLMWFCVLLFMAVCSLLVSSVFFRRPVDLQIWLRPEASNLQTTGEVPNLRTTAEVPNQEIPHKRNAPIVTFLDGKKAVVNFSITTHVEDEDAAVVVVTCGTRDKAQDSLEGKVISTLITELEKMTLTEARSKRFQVEKDLVASLTPAFKKVGLTLDHFSLMEFTENSQPQYERSAIGGH